MRQRGLGAALVLPGANANAVMLYLAEVSLPVAPDTHAALVCASTSWHKTIWRLRVPDNITLLRQPPNSPKPNLVEYIWEYLRAKTLCSSVFDTYDTIVDRCCVALN